MAEFQNAFLVTKPTGSSLDRLRPSTGPERHSLHHPIHRSLPRPQSSQTTSTSIGSTFNATSSLLSMDSGADASKEALLATNSQAPSSFRAPSPSPRPQSSRPSSSLANRLSREIQGVSEATVFAPQRNNQSSIYPPGVSEKSATQGQRELLLRPMSKTGYARAPSGFAALGPAIKPSVFFLIGVLLAIGHHQFNSWAKGRTVGSNPAIPQEWIFRIGTAFAIAFQTILASSLAFVICQLLWFYTHRQYMTINDINTLYLVERRDVISTVLSDAIFRSPLLVTATILSFLLPITTVFTPASLGVITSSFDESGPCQVSAGNFSRDATPILFRHNATVGNYLGGTISSIQRKADASFASQSIPLLPQYCGNNCTYQTSIDSFTFQCQTNVPLPDGHLGDTKLSYLGPGTRVFWNASMAGPAEDPPSPFYVGWQTGAMYLRFDGSVGTNGSALCTPMKAHYDFSVRTFNGEQIVSYNMTPTGPLQSTAFWPANTSANQDYIALQVGAVTLAARSRLLGVVSWLDYPDARKSITTESSPVTMSSFLNVTDSDEFVWGDVITGIQQTAANVTAALLNVDLGLKDSECTFSHSALVYRYKPENLWIPYAITLGLVGASLVLGVIIFCRFNPENLTTSFVDTVGVTRNAELDSLALRYRLGLSDGLDDDDDSARFRLGLLGDGYVGYGTKQSIRSPDKGL